MTDEQRFSESDLSAFIVGEGSPPEREATRVAIDRSPELRRRYETLRKTWKLLDAYPSVQPPPGGLEDLHRRLSTRTLPERRRWTRIARHWQAGAVAACLVVAVGVPALMWMGRTSPPSMPTVIPATTPLPRLASATPAPGAAATLASIPAQSRPLRRFLPGRDGSLQAGITVNVDALAEWGNPVLQVNHMDELSAFNLEDYAITNYDFDGSSNHAVRPGAIPVSTDPL